MKKLLSILFFLPLFLQAQVYSPSGVVITPRNGSSFRLRPATQMTAGAMSAQDKLKLDTLTSGGIGGVKTQVSYDVLRQVSGAAATSVILSGFNRIDGNWYYDSTDVSSPDDSATIVITTDGKRLHRYIERYVNVKWFGAVGDGATDDYYPVQKAINYVVNKLNSVLYFPAGTFVNSTRGWVVWRDNNSDGHPDFCSIEIQGASTAYGGQIGNETTLTGNFANSFVLGIQKGKGCKISNINFRGVNQLNYHQNYSVSFNPATTYNIGVRDSIESPYSGLVIDPFGVGTTGGQRYPGFEDYYEGSVSNGGSTDCQFTNLTFDGFYSCISLTTNATTQNNEQHRFDNIWLANAHTGLWVRQGQSRNIYCSNFKAWESIHTVFRTSTGLPRSGDCPIIDNVNVAGGIFELLDVGGYQLRVKNVYTELLYRLGSVTTEVANFDNCIFDFADAATLGGFKYQDWVMNTTANVEFNNCHLITLSTGPGNKTPMNFIFPSSTGRVLFNNCYLTNEASDAGGSGYYTQHVNYENCFFFNMEGSVSSRNEVFIDQEFTNEISVGPGTKFVNYGKEWTTFNPQSRRNLTQARKATTPFVRYVDLGNFTVTVSGTTATAPSGFTGGGYTYLYGELLKAQIASSPLINPQAMKIDSIESDGTFHFSKVIKSLVTGTYSLFFPIYSKINIPIIGSVTSGSSTVSNVVSDVSGATVDIGVNQLVIIGGQIYATVTSSSGSFTINTNANFTDSRAIISGGIDYLEYGTAASRPDSASGSSKVLFTKGSRYANTSGQNVGGWTVTKTGISNTAYLPEFTTY